MSQQRQVALVTGGSAGIGRAVCAAFIAHGYEVVSLARRAEQIDDPRLHPVMVDLTDRAAVAQVARDVAQRFAVTTIVHNAGAIRPARLDEVDLRDLDALSQLHLGSAVQIVQACLPGMRARRYGRIVLISSRAALGLPTRTSYAATKAGMIGLARTWALELAGDGITVNVVAPGPIRTDMFHELIPAGSDREKQVGASIPVRRLGEPEDVARAVLFFADATAGFVTGQTLYVCGGASVGTLTL